MRNAEFDVEQLLRFVEIGIALANERKRQDGGLTENFGLDNMLFFVGLRQRSRDVEESVAVEFPEDTRRAVLCLDSAGFASARRP